MQKRKKEKNVFVQDDRIRTAFDSQTALIRFFEQLQNIMIFEVRKQVLHIIIIFTVIDYYGDAFKRLQTD